MIIEFFRNFAALWRYSTSICVSLRNWLNFN